MLVRSLAPNGPDRAGDRRFEVVTAGLPLCEGNWRRCFEGRWEDDLGEIHEIRQGEGGE